MPISRSVPIRDGTNRLAEDHDLTKSFKAKIAKDLTINAVNQEHELISSTTIGKKT